MELICVMCNKNRAGADGLCLSCRQKISAMSIVNPTQELLLPEGRYIGTTQNGIPHGKGQIIYSEHDSRRNYVGEFCNGMRQGKGKLVFKNDAYYDGQWSHDKYHGYGEEALLGGNYLEGLYEEGHFVKGHVYFGDGREYEGEWKDDMPNGMGKIFFRDGHAESGFWVNGVCAFEQRPSDEELEAFLKQQEYQAMQEQMQENGMAGEWGEGFVEAATVVKNGFSTEDYPGGERYEGEFLDGKRHGRGTMYYPNGDRYEGEYVDGKRHGMGTMYYAAGGVYAGRWENSKKSGHGTFESANKDRYVGDFQDGAFCGQGTYYFSNGNVYEGEWLNSRRNGSGVMTFADGTKERQNWENGKKLSTEPFREFKSLQYKSGSYYEGEVNGNNRPDGIGSYTYAGVGQYEGTFTNGVREGIGTFVWLSGDSYEGEWKQDMRHGQGCMIYADGRVKEGLFENDEFVG